MRAAVRHARTRRRFSVAPVNAPFSWPNSSLSRISSGIAAQFSAKNGPFARSLSNAARGDELLSGARLAEDQDASEDVATASMT